MSPARCRVLPRSSALGPGRMRPCSSSAAKTRTAASSSSSPSPPPSRRSATSASASGQTKTSATPSARPQRRSPTCAPCRAQQEYSPHLVRRSPHPPPLAASAWPALIAPAPPPARSGARAHRSRRPPASHLRGRGAGLGALDSCTGTQPTLPPSTTPAPDRCATRGALQPGRPSRARPTRANPRQPAPTRASPPPRAERRAVAIASAQRCGEPLSRRTGRRMRALMPPRGAPGAGRTLRLKNSRHAARAPRRQPPCPGRGARTRGATVAGVGVGGETLGGVGVP